MPKTICKEIYQFNELNEKAKEKAREWYREGAFDDAWWDCRHEQFVEAGAYLGITIDTHEVTLIGGKTQQEPSIYFSGFSSQGDGACFLGTWRVSDMKTLHALKDDYCTDTTLHQIHRDLRAYAKRYPHAICTSTRSHSHYSHERSTNLEAILGEDIDYTEATHKPLEECLVDFMQWMYQRLEETYNYLNSNESVDETIRANEYEFNEDGSRA
jgi:hypothetical protein